MTDRQVSALAYRRAAQGDHRLLIEELEEQRRSLEQELSESTDADEIDRLGICADICDVEDRLDAIPEWAKR